MAIHIVGGVYRERCVHPRWNEVYGSAGRAAFAIAAFGTPVVLHSYMNDDALQIIRDRGAWQSGFEAIQTKVQDIVSFDYLHDMAAPEIHGVPKNQYESLRVNEEKIVRFGMLEGDAIVHAEWAVYDPQNGKDGRPFHENGSTAKHLALILNAHEAAHMANMQEAPPSMTAPVLAQSHGAEVVVVKMGAEGAFVWTSTEITQVPAFRTKRVWKVGSGDCFVAHFANAWMHNRKSPAESAEIASRATAYYCETQGLPTVENIEAFSCSAVELSNDYKSGVRPQVYLAGPFFDLAQVWMVEQTRSNLLSMGLRVFSPYHDIGLGSAEEVVVKDLEGIQQSDLLLALTDGLDPGTIYEIGYARALDKPVIVYSERHKDESLKMMEGSGCTLCENYTTALYSTVWEAVKL